MQEIKASTAPFNDQDVRMRLSSIICYDGNGVILLTSSEIPKLLGLEFQPTQNIHPQQNFIYPNTNPEELKILYGPLPATIQALFPTTMPFIIDKHKIIQYKHPNKQTLSLETCTQKINKDYVMNLKDITLLKHAYGEWMDEIQSSSIDSKSRLDINAINASLDSTQSPRKDSKDQKDFKPFLKPTLYSFSKNNPIPIANPLSPYSINPLLSLDRHVLIQLDVQGFIDQVPYSKKLL